MVSQMPILSHQQRNWTGHLMCITAFVQFRDLEVSNLGNKVRSQGPTMYLVGFEPLKLCLKFRILITSSGFHPSTFHYYHFSLEIEFKMKLGVWGCYKFWLKQHKKLIKPVEMALFFGSDKWYSYCNITSNIKDFYTMTIFFITNLSFLNGK